MAILKHNLYYIYGKIKYIPSTGEKMTQGSGYLRCKELTLEIPIGNALKRANPFFALSLYTLENPQPKDVVCYWA